MHQIHEHHELLNSVSLPIKCYKELLEERTRKTVVLAIESNVTCFTCKTTVIGNLIGKFVRN